jgi:hypothetical protein
MDLSGSDQYAKSLASVGVLVWQQSAGRLAWGARQKAFGVRILLHSWRFFS